MDCEMGDHSIQEGWLKRYPMTKICRDCYVDKNGDVPTHREPSLDDEHISELAMSEKAGFVREKLNAFGS